MRNIYIRNCPCCDEKIDGKGGVQLTGVCEMNWMFIKCNKCGLKMESEKYDATKTSKDDARSIMRRLIERWNTRKPIENILEKIEDYREEAEQFGVGGMFADMFDAVKEEGDVEDGI